VRTDTEHFYREAIQRAITAAFLAPNTSPATLAEAAGFSAFHFSRMFAGMVGESPGEFLRRLRLERAAQALQTGQRVTDTAFDAGYESLEAFSRAFRAAFGCAPSEFVASCLATCLPTPASLHWSAPGVVPVFVPHTKGTLMDVTIQENAPSWRVVALRHVGPYNQIGPVFGQLMGWMQANGVTQTGPGLAISHDDPETTPAAELRSDACAIVADDFTTGDPTVQVFNLPGGRYAVAIHLGAYSGLGATWSQFMGEWFPQSGERADFTRPCFEIYVNDCNAVPIEEVRTELYVPIR
jgi:AraC family transcriptional regulator